MNFDFECFQNFIRYEKTVWKLKQTSDKVQSDRFRFCKRLHDTELGPQSEKFFSKN